MKRWVFQNTGLKFLSLLIAFALWAYAGSRQILEQRLNLHVEFENVPAGMALDPNVRTDISVILTGRKDRILNIDTNNLKALVNLYDVSRNQKEIVIRPRIEPLPRGVSATVSDVTVNLIPIVNNTKQHQNKGKPRGHSRR